jgi:DNA-binding MarR family transcriptional regulator
VALDFLSPLHKASRQLSVYLEDQTQALGVSPLEGHVLTYLKSYGPASIRDLLRVFGLKPSTFTSLLDRLETLGCVRRTTNPDDRRSFLVHITPTGRDLAAKLHRLLRRLEADIRSRLDVRDVAGFHAVMTAVDQITQVRLRDR